MRSKRMKTLKLGDRTKSKNEAKKLLKNAREISRRILILEDIPEIRREVDMLETCYRKAAQKSIGDDKVYDLISRDASYKFDIIADNFRDRFGPGELLTRIERYKARYGPLCFR